MKSNKLSFIAECALFQALTCRLDLIRRIYYGESLRRETAALFEIASAFPSVLEDFTKYYSESNGSV